MSHNVIAEKSVKILVSTMRPRRKEKRALRFVRYSPSELKRLRKEFKVKQDELAKFMGISRPMISLWEKENRELGDGGENGKRLVVEEPGLKRLKQLAAFFSEKAGYKIRFWADPDEEMAEEAPDYWGHK